MASSTKKKKKLNPFLWVVEPLMDESSYLQKSMFGCQACYLHGRLTLLLTSGAEPWNGLLIPTEHQFHESIKQDFITIVQHPVLKKWLYLPEASEDFETVAQDIVKSIRLGDKSSGSSLKDGSGRRG